MLISDEVKSALADGGPVVALESTLVAHGLPWPRNLEVGLRAEQAVRAGGAVPATIAVVAGQVRVGLERAWLERLARGGFAKANQSDLGLLVARGGDGATTVSATAFIAARAGIDLFATGGIGGVHHGDGRDVSSDLTTMAAEPVVVVSAGAKAILDLAATLEVLETLGVLVLGFRTSTFPAFYQRSSGLPLEHRVDQAAEVASIVRARRHLGDRRGVLVANPIPEEAALDDAELRPAIEGALRQASARGVGGKALTPFLLAALAEATSDRSLDANEALVLANAELAARIAVALAGPA